MKNHGHSIAPAVAGLLALLVVGVAAPVMAQTPTRPQGKMVQPQAGMKGMKGMEGMHGMMGMMGEHAALAMAYRDNLATFARVVRGQVMASKAVNLNLARPAVAEMRRSFDQMKQHHQAQVTMMGDSAKSAMSANMQHMETHLSALNEHLTALEAELSASTPDPTKVAEHASELLKQGAGMSAMPPKTKSHQVK